MTTSLPLNSHDWRSDTPRGQRVAIEAYPAVAAVFCVTAMSFDRSLSLDSSIKPIRPQLSDMVSTIDPLSAYGMNLTPPCPVSRLSARSRCQGFGGRTPSGPASAQDHTAQNWVGVAHCFSRIDVDSDLTSGHRSWRSSSPLLKDVFCAHEDFGVYTVARRATSRSERWCCCPFSPPRSVEGPPKSSTKEQRGVDPYSRNRVSKTTLMLK